MVDVKMNMEVFLKKNGCSLFFILCSFVFLFCVSEYNPNKSVMDFPHIVLPFYTMFIILLIMLFYSTLLVGMSFTRIDVVFLLLCARLPLHIIPIIYNGIPPHFMLNFIISIFCIVTYLVAYNFNDNHREIEKFFKLFFFFLVIQIVVEYLLSPMSIFQVVDYKHEMCLPIGSSNAIVAKLMPFFAFLFCVEKNKKIKVLLVILTFVCIVLCKSRGGIINFVTVLLILSVWKGHFSVEVLFKCLFFPLIIVGLAYFFFFYSDIGDSLFFKTTSSSVTRLKYISSCIVQIKQHFIFGNGLYYGTLASNPHNFFIDILMRGGFVGLSLMMSIGCVIAFRIKNFLEDDFVRGCVLAIFCFFWHGMVEIVIFSEICDFLMWMFIGCLMGCLKKNELGKE